MSFFEVLFPKKKNGESVILIAIGTQGVSGAYVHYQEGESPVLLYTRHLPIEIRKDEAHERAMLRTLHILGGDLIREGAPILARMTGSGSAHMILVSIDAPWQETTVRTEHFEQKEPFMFTKGLVTEKLKEVTLAPSEKLLADESIIGTILNGYETQHPYGRKVHRASIIILTSLIERNVAHDIIATLTGLFHTKSILPIAGNSLRYQAMRTIFPHERDVIMIDATGGSLTSFALVRKGIFVVMAELTTPSSEEGWLVAVTSKLAEISKNYPLPRTIFLLAHESDLPALRQKLDTAHFTGLWLSDNPPKIVSIMKNSMTGSIRHMTTNVPDVVLLLMTLYYEKRRSASKESI